MHLITVWEDNVLLNLKQAINNLKLYYITFKLNVA